jgi:TolB-like protein
MAAIMAVLSGAALSAQAVSLAQALDSCVAETARKLPAQTRIACPRINAASAELADYATSQLIMRFVKDGRFIVVNRDSLSGAAVDSEIAYQLQGNVSDETAVSITKQLGASAVIAGTLYNAGRTYRLDIRIVQVETNQVLMQWSADVRADDEWKKFSVVSAGLLFEGGVSLVESEKKTVLQNIQRGLQSSQTPLSLPAAVRDAENAEKSGVFIIEVDYEEKNGLTVGEATVTFTRDGTILCASKKHHVSEMGGKRFIQRIAEAIRDDSAFFKQLNDALVK